MIKDNVNHPGHYTAGGIECIDALKAAVTGLEGIEAVCTANAIKYLWRWKRKNGVEDLRKAIWYIEKLIDTLSTTEPVENETCYERAKREPPDKVKTEFMGGVYGCPWNGLYGYKECASCGKFCQHGDCRACWQQTVEEKEHES